MTDQGFRFCPRCGTALVAGLPYCPKCGFNVAEIGGTRKPEATSDGVEADPYVWTQGTDQAENAKPVRPDVPGPRLTAEEPRRRSWATPIIIAGLVIGAALVGFNLLSPPQAGGGPSTPQNGTAAPGGSVVPGQPSAGPTAPIVGITIESPQDGQAVASGEVTVIGIAPPGLTITRDVSFGLDQHTTVDGTGHWAMGVRLEQGENNLVFRIGDDRSTEKRLRVTFVPPAQ
jgi:hypothetical protein